MANNYKGRQLLLEILDSSYKVIGGITTRSFSRDNPVADSTNQATGTTTNDTEACFTGYGTVTISGSGVVDTRATSAIAAYKLLSTAAFAADPKVTLRMTDPQETIQGDFYITNFEKSSEQNGLIEFSLSLQNAGTVTFT